MKKKNLKDNLLYQFYIPDIGATNIYEEDMYKSLLSFVNKDTDTPPKTRLLFLMQPATLT